MNVVNQNLNPYVQLRTSVHNTVEAASNDDAFSVGQGLVETANAASGVIDLAENVVSTTHSLGLLESTRTPYLEHSGIGVEMGTSSRVVSPSLTIEMANNDFSHTGTAPISMIHERNFNSTSFQFNRSMELTCEPIAIQVGTTTVHMERVVSPMASRNGALPLRQSIPVGPRISIRFGISDFGHYVEDTRPRPSIIVREHPIEQERRTHNRIVIPQSAQNIEMTSEHVGISNRHFPIIPLNYCF